jgi:hypothetical protein
MSVESLWGQFFPDITNSDLQWLYRYDESVLVRALSITQAKDRAGRFAKRTARDIGRYVNAVARKLSTKVATVSIDLTLDYQISSDDSARFNAKLEQCGQCLIFVAGQGVYGRFKVDGTAWGAHVFAFFNAAYGQLPSQNDLIGLQIAHSCNQPRCCNPNHLRLTTRSVNLLERDLSMLGVRSTCDSARGSALGKGDTPPKRQSGQDEVSDCADSEVGTVSTGVLTGSMTADAVATEIQL